MKKLFLIALLSYNFLNAQSNIFPPAGNVGVGTTAPFYKLSVASDLPSYTIGMRPSGGLGLFANNVANLNGQLGWVRRADQAPILVLQGVQDAVAWRDVSIARDGGSVGIGTDSPFYKLTVTSNLPPYTIGMRPSGGLGLFTNNVANLNGQLGWVRRADQAPVLVLQGVEDGVAWRDVSIVRDGGNVGIGTANPEYKLDVIGAVRAREVRVNLAGADFVFEDSYKLMPLNELEKFIRQNKHLPEIAPAKEMQENGGDLGSLTVQLLQKIEELTLHAIEQNKEVKELTLHAIEQNKEMNLLKEKMRKLEQK